MSVLALVRRFDNPSLIFGRHIVSNLIILQGGCALLVSNLKPVHVHLRVSGHVVTRLLHWLELYLLLRRVLLFLLFRDLRRCLQRVVCRAAQRLWVVFEKLAVACRRAQHSRWALSVA